MPVPSIGLFQCDVLTVDIGISLLRELGSQALHSGRKARPCSESVAASPSVFFFSFFSGRLSSRQGLSFSGTPVSSFYLESLARESVFSNLQSSVELHGFDAWFSPVSKRGAPCVGFGVEIVVVVVVVATEFQSPSTLLEHHSPDFD